MLMAAVFPAAVLDREYGAAITPFQLRGFYATPPFEQLFLADDGTFHGRMNIEPSTLNAMRLLRAYALVLARVYSIELDLDYSFIFTVADPETGLDRHFKAQFDLRFVDVVPVGPTPPLTEENRRRLHGNLLDRDFLLKILPPEKFVFRGFTILKAVEVTDQEVLSSLKRDLIDKESIVSNARFLALQQKLRALLRRPELRFGLAALSGDQVLILNYGAKSEHACIFADSRHHTKEEFKGSVYERAVHQGGALVIEDLTALRVKTDVDEEIIQSGVRNLVVAPLLYQGRVIGTLELGSPHPGDLNATHLPKLHEVLPLFSMAVQRSMEELNNRIQALIKEKCTAIHPVVEWRFRRAVLKSIEHHAAGAEASGQELEPIVFERVYPLYALSDIRGSSIERSLAIQADVLTQLRLARDVVQAAHAAKRLPALDELLYRVNKHAAKIEKSLNSGDEAGVVTFLRGDVERLFDHLQGFGPAARGDPPRPRPARAALDPVPVRRKAVRRGWRLRHPLRDREEADRQGSDQGRERARDAAREDRHRLCPARRGQRVPRLHRVPPEPRLPDRRGGGPRAGRAPGRARAPRAPRHRRPPKFQDRAAHRAGRPPGGGERHVRLNTNSSTGS